MMILPKDLEKPPYPGPCGFSHCIGSDVDLSADAPPSSDSEDWNHSSCFDSDNIPRYLEERFPPASVYQEKASDADEEDLEDRIRKIRLSYQEEDRAFDEEFIFLPR